MHELEPLINAWREKYRSRAEGGLWAIRGFRYQYLVGLYKALECWSPGDTPRPDFAIEALSDLVTLRPGSRIEIAQAKLRGKNATIRDALGELWTIHQLACLNVPHLVDRLFYKVLLSKDQSKDASQVIDQFAPASGVPMDLALFRSKVEIETTGDPLDALLMKLATDFHLRDPLPTVERWLGQLTNLSMGGGLEYFSRGFWNDLHTASLSAPLPKWLFLWKDTDRPPDSVCQGKIPIGESPYPAHLRDGQFAFRSEAYQRLFEAFDQWERNIFETMGPGDPLPIFWIGGRSGSGKSVSLLHLLSRLKERGSSPILWLGNHVIHLKESFSIADALGEISEAVIALDDPYSPSLDANAKQLWSEIASELIVRRDEGRIPILVCAGPSEQAELLRQDFHEDFQVKRHDLESTESATSLQELRAFYQARSGKTPYSEEDEGDVLVVQRMFQWSAGGNLDDFALRFKKRALGLGLEPWLGAVLAANRLYVGLPEGCLGGLDAGLRDSLELLLSEHHLAIDEGRTGIWITHPHLADVLFEAWYPAKQAHLRKEKTQAACRMALEAGSSPTESTAPLWALERATRADGDPVLHQRIRGLHLEEIIEYTWRYLQTRSSYCVPTALLPVWIGFERLFPNAFRSGSPTGMAIARLEQAPFEDTGLRLCAHRLLQYGTQLTPVFLASIYASLDRLLERSKEWREWLPISMDLAWRRRSEQDIERLCSWAEIHRSHPLAGSVVRMVLELAPENSAIVQRADSLFLTAGPSWATAVEARLQQCEGASIPCGVLEWLSRHQQELSSLFAISKAFRCDPNAVASIGEAWLERWADSPNANFVLEPWWEHTSDPQKALRYARLWASPDRFEADRVYEKLLGMSPTSEDLAGAQGWLACNQANKGWGYVWKALMAQPAACEASHAIAHAWLKNASAEHGSWAFVWKALWKPSGGDEALARLARTWLQSVPNHDSWTFVWKALWDASKGDEKLTTIALTWLQNVPAEHGFWKAVWHALWKQSKGDETLGSLARIWLQNAPAEHKAWGFVWKALWEQSKGDETLVALACNWLQNAPAEHGSWAFVWEALWEQSSGDEELAILARTWLENVPNHDSWTYVWKVIWKESKNDEMLATLARTWLQNAPAEHEFWSFVWEALWKQSRGDEELACLAHTWLQNVSAEHGSWAFVWGALWGQSKGDESLARLARAWLRDAPIEHGSWPFVWVALWGSRDCDDVLRAVGEEWLNRATSHPGRRRLLEALKMGEFGKPEILKAGQCYVGRVKSIQDYGIFVNTNAGAGLLHVSVIPGALRGRLTEQFSIGQELAVTLKEFDEKGRPRWNLVK